MIQDIAKSRNLPKSTEKFFYCMQQRTCLHRLQTCCCSSPHARSHIIHLCTSSLAQSCHCTISESLWWAVPVSSSGSVMILSTCCHRSMQIWCQCLLKTSLKMLAHIFLKVGENKVPSEFGFESFFICKIGHLCLEL